MYANFRSRAGSDLEDLKSALQKATSISSTCREVESYLKNNRVPARDFFKEIFPLLLRKIFGFEDFRVSQPSAVSLFSSSAGGWLGFASRPGNEADAKALISLLSPTSNLFQLLLAVDKDGGIRFLFPTERLPEFVRRLLSSEQGALLLCQEVPAYRSRILQDASGMLKFQLDLFDYFAFWFAYYAVCKDGVSKAGVQKAPGGQQGKSLPQKTPLRTQFGNWKSALPGLHSPGSSRPVNPYQELLVLYLSHLVFPSVVSQTPSTGTLAQSPASKVALWGRPSSPVVPTTSPGSAAGGEKVYGEVLLSALIEFWLIDDDPTSLPWARAQLQQLSQGTAGRLGHQLLPPVYAYLPPRDDLIDYQMTLIGRINSNPELAAMEPLAPPPTRAESPMRPRAGAHGGSIFSPPRDWSAAVPASAMWQQGFPHQNRYSPGLASPPGLPPKSQPLSLPLPPPSKALISPLYRFLLRAFTNWPLDTTVGRISRVVDLWVLYLEPWKATSAKGEGTTAPVAAAGALPGGGRLPSGSPGKGAGSGGGGIGSPRNGGTSGGAAFDAKWQGYVLANYPFYNSLAMHFLELAVKAVQIDLEATLRSVYKALAVLDGSPQLLDLLKKTQVAYNQYLQGGSFHHNGAMKQLLEWAPVIHEELKEWEDNAMPEMDSLQLQHPSPLMQPPAATSMLRLFSQDEIGGARLMQALLARAEIELHSSTGGIPPATPDLLVKVQDMARRVFDVQLATYGRPTGRPAEGGAGPSAAGAPGGPSTPSLGPAGMPAGRGPEGSRPRAAYPWVGVNGWLRSVAGMAGLGWKGAAVSTGGNATAVPGERAAASGTGGQDGAEAAPSISQELRKHTWADVRYKGDYMRRPIEGHEVAFLVRLLVRLSDAVNAAVGLDAEESTSGGLAMAADEGRQEGSGRGAHKTVQGEEARPSESRPSEEGREDDVRRREKGKERVEEGEEAEGERGEVGREHPHSREGEEGASDRSFPTGVKQGSGDTPGRRIGGGDGDQAQIPSQEVQLPLQGVQHIDWDAAMEVAKWLAMVGVAYARLGLGHARRLGLAGLQVARQEARRRGWRVNLRPLAEVQVLILLTTFLILYVAVRAVIY